MKHIHKQRRYDWECEIFKNKDDIIQVNFVEQRTNEIHLHLNKTYLTIEKNFKQPQKVKTWNKHEQICFRAHGRPAAGPTVALLACLLQMSYRQAELHAGKITNRRQDSHTGRSRHTPQLPGSTAELALCVGGTQRKVIQADIIQKLLHHVTLLPGNHWIMFGKALGFYFCLSFTPCI